MPWPIGLYARVSFGIIAAFLLLDLVLWPFVLDVIDPGMTGMQSRSILAEAALDCLVLRLLAKDPADRFESAVALEDALTSCAEDGQWSRADAEAWWAARGEVLERAADSQVVSAPATLTVAVAKRGRTR